MKFILKMEEKASHIPAQALPTCVHGVSIGLPTAFKYSAEYFYARECYKTYYEWVIQLLQEYDYISVTGTPGLYFASRWIKGKAESVMCRHREVIIL
jgi:hypothetical protein